MISLALFGCGGMASVHASRFDHLRDRLQVKAVVDIDLPRAEKVASLLSARAYTNFRDALDEVDAVLIALPHHLHHPVGMECLAAGKHVLMEKPMANSEQECLDLIHAADREGLVLMTAYCMRFHPLVVRMKELIEAQTYGELFQLSLWTEQLTLATPGTWAASAATLGGGQLFSHGCHYIDLLLWFLGNPVEGTHLGTKVGTPWMDWEGTSHVTIKFASDVLGYHFGTWGARGSRLGYSFHAHCTEGMLEAQISQGRLLFLRHGEPEQVLQVEEEGKYTEYEMRHFLDCIETGRRPLTDGPGSLQGLRVIWSLYDAERRGIVADLRGLGLEEFIPAAK